MAKILDYLVENYIYVAAISGFFIIVLIGFLVKDRKKGKNKKDKEEKNESNINIVDNKPIDIQNTETNESIVTKIEESAGTEPKMDFVKTIEENVGSPVVEVKEIEVPTEPTPSVVESSSFEINNQTYSINDVEPSNNKFQVVLDAKETVSEVEPTVVDNKVEVFDLDDTVVLNKKKLDDEVDIIDFSDINKFESHDDIPNPIIKDN